MEGHPAKRKMIGQEDIAVTGKKGDILSFYGWVNSEGIPNEPKLTTQSISARVTLHICKTDGTVQYENIMINSGTDSWQFLSRQIKAEGDYNKIRLYLIYYKNCNTIYFDNLGLFKEEFGESYQYDKKGNLITSQDLAKQNSTFQYSGNDLLIKSVNPKGGNFTYEYNYIRKGRLTNAWDSKGTKYEFAYDTNGNNTSIKIGEGPKSDEIETGKTYLIKSAYSNDKYFDIAEISTKDDAVLQQYVMALGNLNQQFKFEQIENEPDYYRITPMHAQTKALYFDEADDNYIIKQKTYKNKDNFKWKLQKNTNGTYRIESKAKPNYVISLTDKETKNSVQFKLKEWTGDLEQSVYIYDINKKDQYADADFLESDEVYYIKSKTTNLYIEHESDELYAMINQEKFKEKDKKQLWRIVREYDNVYKLIPLGSKTGYALYPKGEKNLQDQRIGIKAYVNSTPQKWRIEKTDNGTYKISTLIEGDATRYLNSLNKSKEPGERIVLNTNGDEYYLEKANTSQAFEEGSTYTIREKDRGIYLAANGTEVEQEQSYTKKDNQRWIIHKEGNGYYSFRLASDTTKVMDLQDGNKASGTNIQVKTATGADSEKFEIIPMGNAAYGIRPKLGRGNISVNIANGTNVNATTTTQGSTQQFYFTKRISSSTDQYIESKATYTSDGKYTSKIQDELGNYTNYEYNDTKGTLSKITDAKGNQVDYTYDDMDKTTMVSSTDGDKTYSNEYTYENDRIKTIQHNNFNYSFVYDQFGNQKQVKLGDNILITNTYEARNSNILNSKYGNGHQINFTYDRFDRITKREGTAGSFEYSYDGRSNLKTLKDNVNNNTITYEYDLSDRVVKEEHTNGYSNSYEYDKNSNVSKITDKLGENTKTIEYNYDLNNNINSIRLYNNSIIINNSDALLRTVNKELKTPNGQTYNIEYGYTNVGNGNKTTTQINSIKNGQDQEIKYTFDKNGNIETISYGTELKNKYYYDSVNQLIREDDSSRNLTITYSYDVGGNITSKTIYPYTEGDTLPEPTETISYTYGNDEWKDQLTKYKGREIEYDAIGNPLSYDGNTLTWQNGRELAGITNNEDGLTVTYKYNDEGIRTQKTVNGVTTTYYLSGNKVVFEQTGDSTIYYSYDQNGELVGLDYNGQTYYYKKNLQGDIIGILDNNLNEVVKYSYDSWGNILSITDQNGDAITDENNIGLINPHRYRGYRYDTETGLYYLQSRYYKPDWGRFINADNYGGQVGDLLSHNGYTYCLNNPINMIDTDGNIAWVIPALQAAGKALLATIGFVSGLIIGGNAVDNVKSKPKPKKEERNHTVYKLVTKETKKVKYVGRTTDIEARKSQHKKDPFKKDLEFQVEVSGLTREEARGLEQILIINYATKNELNKINGISPNNRKIGTYMRAGGKIAMQYLKNIVVDEALYWMYDKWR